MFLNYNNNLNSLGVIQEKLNKHTLLSSKSQKMQK